MWRQSSDTSQKYTWLDWLLLAMVVLVAAVFRFYRLSDLPAGILFDSAVNGNDAWRLWQQGGFTPFLFTNGGRESLFIYLQSLSVGILGNTNFALKLAGVCFDTATATFVFIVLRHLSNNRYFAFTAAMIAATSAWLLAISRLGFRAVMVPLLGVLLAWVFLMAWRRANLKFYALTGVLLGLSFYTYPAAKIYALLLPLAMMSGIFFPAERVRWRAHLRGAGIGAAIAAIIYLPMWLYARAFAVGLSGSRVGSVAIWADSQSFAEIWRAVGENILRSLGYFCCSGNHQLLIFGSLNCPGLDLILGAMLLTGIVLAFKNLRHIENPFLLLWFALGLLPGILAIEAPHPLRLIAAAVPAIILSAQGIIFLSKKIRWARYLFVLWILYTASANFYDYYFRWSNSVEVVTLFNAETAARAQSLLTQTQAGEVIYISQSDFADPVLRYYLLGDLPPRAAVNFVETTDIVQISDPSAEAMVRLGDDESLILPPFSPETHARLSLLSAPTSVAKSALQWQSSPKFTPIDIPPLRLESVAHPAILPPDGVLPVTLYWKRNAEAVADYQIVLQLVDDAHRAWSLDEADTAVNGAYPTDFWRQSDIVADYHALHLRDDLPIGRYRLSIALYDPRTEKRLPLADGTGDTLFIGTLKKPIAPTDFSGFAPTDFHFGDVARLAGYRLEKDSISAGEPISLTLHWESLAEIPVDYVVFVHLLDSEGNLVSGYDNQPMRNQYPTGIWSVGEAIADDYTLPTDGLSAGEYRLAVGMYAAQSGERLPVTESADGQTILSAMIHIK